MEEIIVLLKAQYKYNKMMLEVLWTTPSKKEKGDYHWVGTCLMDRWVWSVLRDSIKKDSNVEIDEFWPS